jgi:CHAD domain-containing protein
MATLKLTSELLTLRTRDVAREVARDRLRNILEEAARLETEPALPTGLASGAASAEIRGDSEAIHDFRVALRRLRTWLKAFGPSLDDAPRRGTRRRLRRLWRLASKARNLEVRQATLAALATAATNAAPKGATDASQQLTDDVQRARRKLTRAVVDVLPRIAVGLTRQLQADDSSGIAADLDDAANPLMAAAMARLLRKRLKELTAGLDRLQRGPAAKRMHAVRIAAKKLRYLLDAFDSQSRLAVMAEHRLAILQDVYGGLHDAQVLDEKLARSGASSLRRDPVRTALRRKIRHDVRRARQVAHSREIVTARQATERLVQQLERRGSARPPAAPRV